MSWIPIFILLLCIFLLYAFIQYTTWTPNSFRRGITVLSFHEPLSISISSALLGQLLDIENMSFKFISPQQCLFRTRTNFLNRNLEFPMLGEISIDSQGTAWVNVRIPLATILIWLAVSIGLILFQMQYAISTNDILIGILKGIGAVCLLSLYCAVLIAYENKFVMQGFSSFKKFIAEKSQA